MNRPDRPAPGESAPKPSRKTLHMCMGSGCHQLGVYQVLPQIQRLLTECGLDVTVELKGSFCLGPCRDGIVMKVDDHEFRHIRPDNVKRVFFKEILPCLKA